MRTAIQLGSRWETLIPAYQDVAALKIKVGPIGRTAVMAAQTALADVLAGVKYDDADDVTKGHAREAYAREMAVHVIEDWEGVGDDQGKLIERQPEPDEIRAMMRDSLCNMAFDEKVVAPYLARVAEKNGYSPSAAAGTVSKGASIAPTVKSRKVKQPVVNS